MRRLVANSNLKLLENTRKKINKALQNMEVTDYRIPIGKIYGILEEENIIILDDDYTKLEFNEFIDKFGKAEEINTYLSIAHINTGIISDGVRYYTPIQDSVLYLSWIKTEDLFDVNCYVS